MEQVKVAFDQPILPGDTVAWVSRRRGWQQGKVRRTRVEAAEGYKYDYVTKTSSPTIKYKTSVTVTKTNGRWSSCTTFTRPQNLVKLNAGQVLTTGV